MPKKPVTKSATITARIAPPLEKRLESYARAYRKTKSKAIQDILEQFLDYDNWVIREVRKGIAAADRGEIVSHDEAVKYIRASATKKKVERRKAA